MREKYNLDEVRKLEMYRILVSTSKIREETLQNYLYSINNEESMIRNLEKINLIDDVFKELCGLSVMREGVIKTDENE